ncbi:MAG: orotidine-5'-phosphate decarboxylase [Candidatus Diapherotrites archaeon]|nr:orotidine-5'-phosphate decarboxylase [Candidatus Diapherotrites archaeon]
MNKNFADRLIEAIEKKENPTVVGLDPWFKDIPESLKKETFLKFGDSFESVGKCILEFNTRIIDAVCETVPAVKLQMAAYEQYLEPGINAFRQTTDYARKKGLVVFEDGKRNDIGSTAQAYADGHIGEVALFEKSSVAFGVDAITVSPYLGSDGIRPFIENCSRYGNGIFVLVKTSNPSSSEVQDLECSAGNKKIYEVMAEMVNEWGKEAIGETGYSSVGAVVGATYPEEAAKLRKLMPNSIFLVPGYGAQGGGAKDVVPCFNPDGRGAIVNSSRGVIFAYKKSGDQEEFAGAAKNEVLAMQENLNKALSENGIPVGKKTTTHQSGSGSGLGSEQDENKVFTGEKIAEGKTKTVFEDAKDENAVLLFFRDDITAGDGAKHDIMGGKGKLNWETTTEVFRFLESKGIATHFISSPKQCYLKAKKVEMIPIECVARRLAYGSLLKRLPFEKKHRFEVPLVEFFFKDDEKNDPMVTDQHIRTLAIAGADEVNQMREITRKVFELLEEKFTEKGSTLVDMKIEFGRAKDGSLLVADEITGDSWRLWEGGEESKMMDKQIYRNGASMQDVKSGYEKTLDTIRRFDDPQQKE